MSRVVVRSAVLFVLVACAGCSRQSAAPEPAASGPSARPPAAPGVEPVGTGMSAVSSAEAPAVEGAAPPENGPGTVTLVLRHGPPVDAELTEVSESTCPADTEFLEGEPIIAEVQYADVMTEEDARRRMAISSSGMITASVGCEVVASDPTPPATSPRRKGAVRHVELKRPREREWGALASGTQWIWLNAAAPGLRAGRYTIVGKAQATTGEPVQLTIKPRPAYDMGVYARVLGDALRSKDDATRKRAALYLGFSGSDLAAQVLADYLGSQTKYSEAPTEAFRYVWATVDCSEALIRAAEERGPQALSPLLDLFGEPTERTLRAALKWLRAPDKDTRGFAAYMVSKHHAFGYQALNPLLERLRGDPSPRVRAGVARSLGSAAFPQQEARQALIAAVRDPSAEVCVAAIRQLSYRKDLEAIPVIGQVAMSRGFEESEAAARALGDLKSDEAVPALGKAMRRRWDTTWGPAYDALDALRRIDTDKARAEIKASYQDCEEPVRSSAAAYLLGKGDDSVREDLARYIREAPTDRATPRARGGYTIATATEICDWVWRAVRERGLAGPPGSESGRVEPEAWIRWLTSGE